MKKFDFSYPPPTNQGFISRLWKKSIVIALALALAFPIYGLAQDAKVSLRVNNASLETIIKRLQTSSPYTFVYRNDEVDKVRNITISFSNEPVKNILDAVLDGTSLGYRFSDNRIVIVPAGQIAASVPRYRVAGKVSDENNQPMPGVTVQLKGASRGVSTDMNGNYVFSFEYDGTPVLVYSYIGYGRQEMTIPGSTDLDVQLRPDVKSVDEIVVLGMAKKVESFTGSFTHVSQKEIRENYSRDVIQTLSIFEPSMRIVANNAMGSDPNFLPEIQIRGTSSIESITDLTMLTDGNINLPLFVVDDFETTYERVRDLNDYEIESIVILKDAGATALYGSRGANGVIVITTSRPDVGELRVTFSSELSLQIPDLTTYDRLNSREKLYMENYFGIWDSQPANYADLLDKVNNGLNYDWMKLPTRTALGHKQSVKVQGGDPNWRYGADFQYNSNPGVMKGSFRDNYNGSVTLEYTKNRITVSNYLLLGTTKSSESTYGSFGSYAAMNRYWVPYDEEGNAYYNYSHPSSSSATLNPAYNASLNTWNKSKTTNYTNVTGLRYDIIDNKERQEVLRVRGSFSFGESIRFNDSFVPPSHIQYESKAADQRGLYSQTNNKENKWQASVNSDYIRTFNEVHNLTVSVRGEISETKSERYDWSTTGFSVDNLDRPEFSSSYQDGGRPRSNESIIRRVGYMASANYYYDQRYFIDASYRGDGGSSFGPNTRWGNFWSLGAGWMLTGETFVKENLPWINYWKLRYTYGVSGSLNFSPEQAMSIYSLSSVQYYLNDYAAFMDSYGNDYLKWQNTYQHNIGMDLFFLEGRLQTTWEYYRKMTNNTVTSVALSPSHGYESYTANMGKVRNEGYELRLVVQVLRNQAKKMYLNLNANIAHNKNTLIELSPAFKKQLEDGINREVSSEGARTKYIEGKSMDAIYANRTAGVDPSNGHRMYYDLQGNLTFVARSEDIVYIGNTQPKANGNIGASFAYGGFSVNVNFLYRIGGYAVNNTLLSQVDNARIIQNLDKRVLTQTWMKPGDVVRFQSMGTGETTTISDEFIQKDNVLQGTGVNVSYMFNENWTKRHLHLSALRVGASMSDIFYLSTVKRERGLSYPFSRNPMFNVSFTF